MPILSVEVLRCPASGAPLLRSPDGAFVTLDGKHRYEPLGGVPVLLSDANVFSPSDVVSTEEPRRLRSLLARLPTGSRNVEAADRLGRVANTIAASASASRPQVLIIGGGTLGDGMDRVVSDARLEVLETDVYIGPRTELVCDAHHLPFADGSFDGVICQAVLEHVVDPGRVVAEIHRVLRPGGIAYSEVPFMQQVHGGAQDFTRFTHLGHRRLYRCFEEIESGAQGGPGMALSWSCQYFLTAFPRRSRLLRFGLARLAALLTFWLTWFDSMLVRRPGGLDGASGTYFLGRRQEDPVADAEILAGFRGFAPRVPGWTTRTNGLSRPG